MPLLLLVAAALATPPSPSPVPSPPIVTEVIEVTAKGLHEETESVPAMVTVVSGEETRGRNADDLRSALVGVAGVDVAPGSDNGPASSVPEFWGLKEFDAFLLVADEVPWGGAFNPALSTVDLEDLDRIEVLRGPAPVMYGATSFVGVVHVVHRGNNRVEIFSRDLRRMTAIEHDLGRAPGGTSEGTE